MCALTVDWGEGFLGGLEVRDCGGVGRGGRGEGKAGRRRCQIVLSSPRFQCLSIVHDKTQNIRLYMNQEQV